MEGISANANAGNPARWDWVRLADQRAARAGPHDDDRPPDGAVRQEPRPLQLRVPGALRGHAAHGRGEGCHKRGEDWIGLGNNQAPTQMSPEATSTAGRGYFDVPFYVNQGTWTMPASNKLLLEAGFTVFRYQPIFGHPAPDGITNLIPVTRAVERDQPGDRACATHRWRTTGIAAWRAGALPTGKTDDILTVGVLRHRRAQRQDRLSVPQLDLLDKDMANSHAAWLSLQPGRAERGQLLPARLRSPHDHEDAQLLHAGQLDARPPHAAGRAALGPRVELRAVRTERHDRTRRS